MTILKPKELRALKLDELHDPSSESPLWYQLYIGQEKEGNLDRIMINNLMYLVDVREAIFNKYEATLRHITANKLYIYPPDTNPAVISDETESYSPRMKLSELKEEVDEEDTLVVVAPAKDSGGELKAIQVQQNRDIILSLQIFVLLQYRNI